MFQGSVLISRPLFACVFFVCFLFVCLFVCLFVDCFIFFRSNAPECNECMQNIIKDFEAPLLLYLAVSFVLNMASEAIVFWHH